MNTVEPVLLKELNSTDYESLINYRIRKILMICSSYDAFILEEDGQIEAQIYQEYIELNLSNPPKFIWVHTAAEARELLNTVVGIDMVMCMYNVTDKEVFKLASEMKVERPTLPFVLLTHFSKEVYRRLALQDTSGIDHMFCWHGNADLIVAIVKLFEDLKNAEHDILGVRANCQKVCWKPPVFRDFHAQKSTDGLLQDVGFERQENRAEWHQRL